MVGVAVAFAVVFAVAFAVVFGLTVAVTFGMVGIVTGADVMTTSAGVPVVIGAVVAWVVPAGVEVPIVMLPGI